MNPEQPAFRQDDQFKELLSVLRRRRAILLGTIVLFLGLGATSVLLTPPSYRVTSRVLLQDYYNGPSSPATDPVARMSQIGAAPEIGAQIGLLQSPQVLTDAFQRANASLPNAGDLAGQVVDIEQEGTSPVLSIQVNLPSGDDAVRVAQAIPAAYNESVVNEGETRTRTATETQRNRTTAARAAFNKAQSALDAQLGKQGEVVAASGAEGQERTSRLNSLQQQLDGARVNLSGAEAQYQESIVAQSRIPEQIKDIVVRNSEERLANEERTIADLEGQLKSLLVANTPASPEVRAIQAKLNREYAYRKTIPTKINSSGTVRNPERAGYDQRVAEAKARLESARVEVAKYEPLVAAERAGLEDFQRRVPIQRQLENDLEDKRVALRSATESLNALEALAAKSRQPVRLLSTTDAAKTQPVVGRTLIAAMLLGVVAGMMAALLRDRFDNRIYTLEQVYDASGAMPIGQVPASTRALAPGAAASLRNRVLESYRSLRFNLESGGSVGATQSVLVSSASAGEGRAGLSLNLATEAATDARRTILVDADMRTPELHDTLKLSRGPGLADVLTGSIGLEEALQTTGTPNLMFLSAGTENVNPLELLTGPSFSLLHESLKERADVIIMNSPSLMRYTDARAIAKEADSVLFVAKRGFTRRDAMRYCIGMLRRTQARLLGVVLSEDGGRTTDVPYFAAE